MLPAIRKRVLDSVVWVLVATVVAWPLGMLLWQAGRTFAKSAHPMRSFLDASALQALGNSVWSAAIATILAVGIGFSIARTLFGLSGRISVWGRVAALLPLLIPPFVGAFSWVQAYAKAGTTDWLLHKHWDGLFGPAGVIVLLAVHSSPVAYLSTTAALAKVGAIPTRAARIHGAGAWKTFLTVTWPSLKPTLMAATGLIFAYNLGDFGIPFELGVPAHFATATTQIYADLSMTEGSNGFTSAILLAIALSALGLAVLIALQSARSFKSRQTSAPSHAARFAASPRPEAVYSMSQHSSSRAARPVTLGRRVALAGFALYTAVSVIIPFFSTLLVGLTRAYGLTPTPGNWDVRYFFAVFQADNGSAARNSLFLAALAGLLVATLGVLTAEFAHRTIWGHRLNKLAWLPYALPGSVVGVATILGYSRLLYGTLLIILLAYVARFWGLSDPIVQVRAQVPSLPIRAAQVFGTSRQTAYRVAIWPYLAPAVQTTALLVFVSALYELTISSLLYTPSSETLAVVVLSANQACDVRTTAVISVWMTLLMVVAVITLNFLRVGSSKTTGKAASDE